MGDVMRILVVERDDRLRAEFERALRAEGHEISTTPGGQDTADAVRRHVPQLVLCDTEAAGQDGGALVAMCRVHDANVLVIMTGPSRDDESALASIRGGAFDYLPKPVRADHVVLVVEKAVAQETLRREVKRLRDALKWAGGDETSPAPGSATAFAATGAAVDAQPEEDLSVKRRTARLERTLIRRALAKTGGNRTRAARLLELSHRALLYKIREYGLQS